MKLGLYGIKDELRGFINVVIDDNDSTAMRNFNKSLGNDSDYSVWCIGSFDSESDNPVIASDVPKLIARGRKEIE